MKVSQKIAFDGHKHNNFVIQKLKNTREKISTDSSKECNEKLEKRLGDIFREISLRNESNSFKMMMSFEIQKLTNLNKVDAYYKFMMLSYSKMFLALVSLNSNYELENIQFHTLELKKLNYIFKNCNHFNIKCNFLKGQSKYNLGEKTRNIYKEVLIPNQKKCFQKDELGLLNRIDSLNNSVNKLKDKIKNYFLNNIKEEINISKKITLDVNSISLIGLKSNIDLCSFNSNILKTSNDENSTNSEEEVNIINANKHLTVLDAKNKNGFKHRRSIETISFTGNKLENAAFVEFSPAPKYHSRSKTQNTNILRHRQSNNNHSISFNGVIHNKSTI